jgi:hypothetical protein
VHYWCGRLARCCDSCHEFFFRQHLRIAFPYFSKKLFAVRIAVLAPPLRFFRLVIKRRHCSLALISMFLGLGCFFTSVSPRRPSCPKNSLERP